MFNRIAFLMIAVAAAVSAAQAQPLPSNALQPVAAPPSAPALASAVVAPVAPVQADQRLSALMAQVHLKVVHPDQVRKDLAAAATAVGGHPMRIYDQGIVLKVPPAALGNFLRDIGTHGVVLTKTLSRQDLTESIAEMEGRLRSQREIIGQLRAFFDRSNLQATLDIERNMTQLVEEAEGLRGELRVAQDRAHWAVVDVAFQFQQRDRVVYVQSPFEWLNTVDLDRMISNFDAASAE